MTNEQFVGLKPILRSYWVAIKVKGIIYRRALVSVWSWEKIAFVVDKPKKKGVEFIYTSGQEIESVNIIKEEPSWKI